MSENPTSAPHAALDSAVPLRNYGLLFFLTMLNVMNFIDRQLIASFANFIIPDLQLSDTQFGLLTGLVFIFFYAIMGLFAGALADRVHRPKLVAAGVFLWSLLTAASGAARGFVSLAIPRMFIGVGESVMTPSAMSILADRIPAHRLGFAAGVYYAGVPIGVGASLLIAGYLGPAIGWRNCFYLLGAIGIVMALFMLLVKETPGHGQAHKQTDGQSKTNPVIDVFNALRVSPSLGLTMAGGVALHFVLGAAAFDQVWLVQERGFDRDEILQISGWVAVFAGVAGNLFGGIVGDIWQAKTGQGRPMLLFWIMLITAPISIIYRIADPDSILFWLGLGTGFFVLGCFYGPTFSTVQELSPAKVRATVVAFYLLSLNLIGLGIGVTIAGISIDMMKAQNVEEPYTWALFTFTLISLLAVPLFFAAGRRFHQDRARVLQMQE